MLTETLYKTELINSFEHTFDGAIDQVVDEFGGVVFMSSDWFLVSFVCFDTVAQPMRACLLR